MIEIAILKNFDSGTYTASVQLSPSTPTYFDTITVARNIASAQMVVGRHVIVVAPDDNPRDAVVMAVFTP